MNIEIIFLFIILFVSLVYCYNRNIRTKRISKCIEIFTKYPLYARRLLCAFNQKNKTNVAQSLIDNYNMQVTKQIIIDVLPSYVIKQLSYVNLENPKIVQIEKGLNNILDLFIHYPRAISIIFSYSSLSMKRFFLNKPFSIDKILTITDTDIIHRKLNVPELQAIEASIDNIFRLDNNLYNINPIKSDAKAIIDVLRRNGQEYLYHFTHKENLKQIIELGGLYSWVKLDEMKKPCQHPGSTSLSRSLDVKYGVADYVHLSFCFEHPMSFRNDNDIVILLIHPIVCLQPDTLFSNMNATDSEHLLGPNLEDLNRVNFFAVNSHLAKAGTKLFKSKQAEVLVKSFIPSEYIINLHYAD